MDDVFGRLRRQPVLAARSDQPHQRAASLAAVGVSDRRARPSRDDAAGDRRRHVPDDAAEPRVCGGHAHRPAALALPADLAERDVALLRSAEPRLRRARRPPVHGHARRARREPRREDGARALGCRRGRRRQGLQLHRRAARREEPDHRRRRRRRVRRPRLHRRLRGGDGNSARGGCTRFPAKARRATTPGRATRGSAAARRPGSPARTIRRST